MKFTKLFTIISIMDNQLTVDGTTSESSVLAVDSLYCSKPDKNKASSSVVSSQSGKTCEKWSQICKIIVVAIIYC